VVGVIRFPLTFKSPAGGLCPYACYVLVFARNHFGFLVWLYITLLPVHCQGIYHKFPEFSQLTYTPRCAHFVYFLSFYGRLVFSYGRLFFPFHFDALSRYTFSVCAVSPLRFIRITTEQYAQKNPFLFDQTRA